MVTTYRLQADWLLLTMNDHMAKQQFPVCNNWNDTAVWNDAGCI